MVEQWTHKPLVGGSNPPFAIFGLIMMIKLNIFTSNFDNAYYVVKVQSKNFLDKIIVTPYMLIKLLFTF